MSVVLSPIGGFGQQFVDNGGNPLSGGKLYTYAAGTTTPLPTYTDYSGVTPNPNPIILGVDGRNQSGQVWNTEGISYKFVLKTNADVLVATWDNIPNGNPLTTKIQGITTVGQSIPTGFAWTKLTAPTISLDRANEWSAVNSKFTCVIPGVYDITMNLTGNTSSIIAVYKNGVALADSKVVTGNISMMTRMLESLVAGDYIEFYTAQNSGGAIFAMFSFSISLSP